MSIRRIVLAAALACAGSATAAAAQEPSPAAGDSAWVNRFTLMHLRDELADRPSKASLESRNQVGWMFPDLPVVLPEPFRSRAFAAESYVLLDVDSAGDVAGCQPLRAGTYPELDAFACTLLTGPRGANLVGALQLAPGRRVAGLWWRSLSAAAYREQASSFSGMGRAGGIVSPPPSAPQPQAPPPS